MVKAKGLLDAAMTPEFFEDNHACSEGKAWVLSVLAEGETLSTLLPKFERADWMLWTLRRATSLNKVQYVELAVLCAKSVLAIYEKKYPNDDRPRKAIEAAIKYAQEPTEENRNVAAPAAAAAYAADAAYAAYAAAYAADAAYAAAAAAYAADAAYAAAAAADAAYAADASAARLKHHKKMCALLLEKIEDWAAKEGADGL